jgi:hypothetical protein
MIDSVKNEENGCRGGGGGIWRRALSSLFCTHGVCISFERDTYSVSVFFRGARVVGRRSLITGGWGLLDRWEPSAAKLRNFRRRVFLSDSPALQYDPSTPFLFSNSSRPNKLRLMAAPLCRLSLLILGAGNN